MEPIDRQVLAGSAIYSDTMLAAYDFLVLSISNSYIWRCNTSVLLEHYNEHVSTKHFDIGVGTGFFLDRCVFPHGSPDITLGDLNENCLARASRRISRFRPDTIRMNVFDPATYPNRRFDSIGINYLLHCLPGPFQRKRKLFGDLKLLLNKGGVLFGSTILGDAPHNFAGTFLMGIYNRKGIFSNVDDSLRQLDGAIMEAFGNSEIRVEGCVAIFAAKVP